MGRYAFFNTSFEYKFAFAIQPSSDMQIFGGSELASKEDDSFAHSWTKDDLPDIKETLEILSKFCKLDLLDFETYEKSIKGTNKLWHDLYDKMKSPQDYTFMLGCIIYHQLLYTDPLTVEYEG